MIKALYKIHSMFDGVRIYAVFLSVVCLFTTFLGLRMFTMINNEAAEYRIVKSNTLGRAYYFCDNGSGFYFSPEQLKEYKAELREYTALDKFFTFKYGCDVVHEEGGRLIYGSIVLLEPGFYEYFPLLKNLGLDFSEDPDGCVIGSNYFKTERGEKLIEFKFWSGPNTQISKQITVCGRLRYPYRFIYPSGGGTDLRINDIIKQGHIIIMQDTESFKKMIGRESSTLNMFILTVKDDASDTEVQALLDKLETLGTVKSFDDMLTEGKASLQTDIKNLLPRPLFNLAATLIAYLSMVVLLVRKKQKDMAVIYLCGASKGKIIAAMIGACCLVSLVPCLINGLLVIEIPKTDVDGLNAFLTPDLIWIVVIYFAITVVIAAVSVAVSFAGRSPIENLRGLE